MSGLETFSSNFIWQLFVYNLHQGITWSELFEIQYLFWVGGFEKEN